MTLRQLLEDKTMKTAIETMLNDFCDLTGLAAVLNDASGNRLTELSNISSYCKIIRARDNQCCLSDKKGADIAAKVGETCIYICHAGLIDFAIPIIVNGEHIGSIMAGQVRSMRPLSIDFSSRLEDECDSVIEKYEAIPFMTNEQLQKSARVLGIIRQYIIECIEKKSLARQAEKQSTGIVRIDEFADLSSRIAIKMHNLLYMEGKHLLYELLDNYVVPETRQIHLQLFEKIFTEQLTVLKLSIPQRSTLANYSDLLVLRKETNSDYYIKLYDYLFEDIILNKRFREKTNWTMPWHICTDTIIKSFPIMKLPAM